MEKTPNTPNTPNTPKPSESNNLGSGHQTASTKLGGSRLKVMHKTMEDFKICRNHDVVEKDIRFLKERKKDFTPKGKEADGFERITSNGMITDRWLGNIPNKRGLVPFRVENVFMAKNSDETPYDDVVNKIDYTVSLDIPNRQDPIFIGFDVTLDINALEDKLLRTTTDPDKKVPFGFSGLDYCYTREGQMLPQISNVPRYCLTMDLNEEKLDRYNHDWFLLRFPPKDKKGEQYEDAKKYISNFNARTRFMVLSEIYEQNKLYKAMLPPLNGKDNLTIKDAESKLDAIQRKLFFPLYLAASNCPLTIEDSNTDGATSEADDEAEAVKKKRTELSQEIKRCNESEPDSEQKNQRLFELRQELYYLVSDYIKTKDSHYSALLDETKHLSGLEQQGKLDSLKAIKPRNVSTTRKL